MFNVHDLNKNTCQLFAGQGSHGYDWWWHNFTGHDAETGEERAFFVEFFICNPLKGAKEPILGQLPENQKNGIAPSYLMVKAGTWGEDACQLHRFFGWDDVKVSRHAPIKVKAGDCFLTETGIKGSVQISAEDAKAHPEWMCDAGSIQFRLKVDKQIAFNVGYGTSPLLRATQPFEMFWHAEGMKTAYEGEVIYNGRKFIVSPDSCYGYADKNWGKDFTSPWVWLSSNDLTSEITGLRLENSVFDIGGGRPKIGPVELSGQLLAALWYEEHEYEYNFSKVWLKTKTDFTCQETDTQIIWHIEQSNQTSRMVTDVTCEKKDMLLVNYEAPDGSKRHNRLWNGGNGVGTIELYDNGQLLDRIHAEHIGCEYGEYDE